MMKKRILILAGFLVFLTLTLDAQKVALHSASGIQHFTGSSALINAYSAALTGDTIYLAGGGFNAPTKFAKSLLIFGAGHYPDSTSATSKTYINGNIVLSDEADGFHLEGVHVNGAILTEYNEAVDNIIIKYCIATSDLNVQGNLQSEITISKNLTIINSVFQGGYFYLSNAENAGIFNSIIQGRVTGSYGNSLENNIFTFNYTGTSAVYTVSGDNNSLFNNIFLNTNSRLINGISNLIKTNIFVNASPLFGTTPIESGNYYPVTHENIFLDQSGYVFDYSHNYHLQNPGTYLGVDETEVGLYGGTLGYKEGAVPSNPHIEWEDVAPTTTSDGLLNVRIKASAQDY